MSDTCTRCGKRPAAPGKHNDRCPECMAKIGGKMDDEEQSVMATEETYTGQSNNDIGFSIKETALMVGNAATSLLLGSVGAIRIVYGTWNPALSPGNALLFPAVFILAMVMMVVWLMVFSAAIDIISNAIQWVTRRGHEE